VTGQYYIVCIFSTVPYCKAECIELYVKITVKYNILSSLEYCKDNWKTLQYSTILYVQYCTVLNSKVDCTILYVQYCSVLNSKDDWRKIIQNKIRSCVSKQRLLVYCNVLYSAVLKSTILCSTVQYCTIHYCKVLYNTLL